MTQNTIPQTPEQAQATRNSRGLETLREYSKTELRTSDLVGFAAHDAEKVLLDNWTRAIADGSKEHLPNDIDQLISRLQAFRAEAVKQLPVANGGLAGLPLEHWKNRLAGREVFVYPCPHFRVGYFGFDGCDAADYRSEDDAIIAAVAHHFG